MTDQTLLRLRERIGGIGHRPATFDGPDLLRGNPLPTLVPRLPTTDPASINGGTLPLDRIERLLKSFLLKTGNLTGHLTYRHDEHRSNGTNRLAISLFYLTRSGGDRTMAYHKRELRYLIERLTSLLKSEVYLEMTRLYDPHAEGKILAQSLGLESYKTRFLRSVTALFKGIAFDPHLRTPSYLSYLSGIKVRLGGRTYRQRILPRKTTQTLQKGGARQTVDGTTKGRSTLLRIAHFTHQTKRGSYRFTVHSYHPFSLKRGPITFF